MNASLFDRLLNASPRSVGRWVQRRLRISSVPKSAAPAWERVTAGPLTGREILIDRGGTGAWDDMLTGCFDPEIYEAIAQALPARGGIVWDVGAHIGFHSLGFSTLVGPAGQVVAFEPNPSNRERLQQNLERHPDLASRIEILSCALSDRDGESAFAISHDIDSGASSMSFLQGATSWVDPETSAHWDRVIVPTRTADGLMREGRRSPNVIKIDVEGAELLVLRGATETMSVSRPTVIVEVHSAKLAFEVHAWFKAHDYDVRLLAELEPSRVLVCARR